MWKWSKRTPRLSGFRPNFKDPLGLVVDPFRALIDSASPLQNFSSDRELGPSRRVRLSGFLQRCRHARGGGASMLQLGADQSSDSVSIWRNICKRTRLDTDKGGPPWPVVRDYYRPHKEKTLVTFAFSLKYTSTAGINCEHLKRSWKLEKPLILFLVVLLDCFSHYLTWTLSRTGPLWLNGCKRKWVVHVMEVWPGGYWIPTCQPGIILIGKWVKINELSCNSMPVWQNKTGISYPQCKIFL